MIFPKPLPPHPRLLASETDWARLRRQADTDPISGAFWSTLRRRADELLDEPLLVRTLTGRRLLTVCREALERICALALVGRVGGQGRHARRAIEEMVNLARFVDWNPKHFLDVAEAALAVAIGYDWLFDAMTEAERREVRIALVEKALNPSLDATARHNWWQGSTENWAQVCHGGLCAAAIAVAHEEPELAEHIVSRALQQLPAVGAQYAPDGVYPEGPMYWNYGTSYHVVLCAALQRLTGDAKGLDAFEGFAESGDFMAQVTGPTGRFFNYGDCADLRRMQVPLFWMARRFGRPDWLRNDLDQCAGELALYAADPKIQYGYYDMVALAWLWFDPSLAMAGAPAPRSWLGRGLVPLAVLRNHTTYVALKGGSASVGHAHMDAGSFVLETDGVRWAVDPGMQDYNSLESAGIDLWNQAQDSPRWSVFRIGAEAHNILRFDGAVPKVDGRGEISVFSGGQQPAAIVDLADVYPEAGGIVRRGVRLLGEDGVLVQDEWPSGSAIKQVTWQFLTEADVTLAGRDVQLDQEGRSLLLRVLGSDDVSVRLLDVSAPASSYDAPNPRLRKLIVVCPSHHGHLRLLALRNPQTPTPRYEPLSSWDFARG